MGKVIDSYGPDGRRDLRFIDWDDSMADHIQKDDWVKVVDENMKTLLPFQEKIKSIEYHGEQIEQLYLFKHLEALCHRGTPVNFNKFPMLKDIDTAIDEKKLLSYLNHSSVEKIQLERANAKDLTFLNEAIQLRSLGITFGSLQNLKGIEVMSHLRELKLKRMGQIVDISNIASCQNLESVEFVPVPKLKDISSLHDLKRLSYLFVESKLGEQEHLDWIKGMPHLECAGIWVKTKRIDWDIIANHPMLYDFSVNSSDVIDQPDDQDPGQSH